jgi:hypothetical protein
MLIEIKQHERTVEFVLYDKPCSKVIKNREMILKCDGCDKIFSKRYVKKWSIREHHYCSIDCVNKCDVHKQKSAKTKEERYGDPNYNNREKCKETKIENWGNPGYNNMDKNRATKLERYGDENYVNAKQGIKTKLEKYGDNYFSELAIDLHNNMTEEKKLARIEKIRETQLSKDDEFYEKRNVKTRKTKEERYGDPNYVNITEESKRKRHETMKRNGSYGKSKTEDMFYTSLIEAFDAMDIVRQKRVIGCGKDVKGIWALDFYIISLDLYVRFNGDYFHGRNFSVEELIALAENREKINGKVSQYRKIAETKQLDKIKDIWFKENNLKMVVVWETDFLKMLKIKGDIRDLLI